MRRHFPLSCSLTMFQIGIAIGAIAVLTRRKQFWMASPGFGAIGLVFPIVWRIIVG